jgi:hypothetical protein
MYIYCRTENKVATLCIVIIGVVLDSDSQFHFGCSELVFVDLLWSPRIDSQAGVPVRQPYLSYRPDKLHRLAKPIPRNRFLGSINVYKYGLWRFLFKSDRKVFFIG